MLDYFVRKTLSFVEAPVEPGALRGGLFGPASAPLEQPASFPYISDFLE